jgi:hypothetical protein
MHQIIGGFILGTVVGQAARKNVWRPVLRGSIKSGLILTQQAKELAKKVKAETDEIVAQAKEELERADLEKSRHHVESQPGSTPEAHAEQSHPGRSRKKKV